MRVNKLYRVAFAVLLGTGIWGCTIPEGADQAPASNQPFQVGEYRIGPDDELRVTVWKNETLSQTVPVRPDGMISLPLLNDVKAAGLTPEQLRDVITKKLSAYESNPEVSVIVTAVHSLKVSVLGQVVKPGTFEIDGHSTVLDALAQAQGLSPFAARSRIVVLRHDGPNTKRLAFDYDRAVRTTGSADNFYLRPGDVIVVP